MCKLQSLIFRVSNCLFQALSDIVTRLQALDGKVDLLLKQGREQNKKLNSMGQSRSETSSPTSKREVSPNSIRFLLLVFE